MKFLCFEINYIGFGNQEWKDLAKSGNKLAAIKSLRKAWNFNLDLRDPDFLSLREAVNIVDKYIKNIERKNNVC